MRVSTLLLRRIHKWIGLLLGLQFILWTVSGAMMALLDMEAVAGGERTAPAAASLPAVGGGWSRVTRTLGDVPATAVSVRPLLDRHVFEIATADGIRLFDAADGRPVQVNADLARRIARAHYPGTAAIGRVSRLSELTLAVREHRLPIWRVDFADDANSSFYVSAATGRLLERRNDSWRAWDFFWMLHNMDYANRTSFNHPLIITVGFGMLWLAVTGLWMLFRTAWRPDFNWLRRR